MGVDSGHRPALGTSSHLVSVARPTFALARRANDVRTRARVAPRAPSVRRPLVERGLGRWLKPGLLLDDSQDLGGPLGSDDRPPPAALEQDDVSSQWASGGARSLDDVMRSLRAEARTAPLNESGYHELGEGAFRERVEAERGPAGVERFEAVVHRGEIALPPEGAYGPCFARREPTPGQYEWVRVEGVPDARCGERP